MSYNPQIKTSSALDADLTSSRPMDVNNKVAWKNGSIESDGMQAIIRDIVVSAKKWADDAEVDVNAYLTANPATIAQGGTGQATRQAALNALASTGNIGDALIFNGTDWGASSPIPVPNYRIISSNSSMLVSDSMIDVDATSGNVTLSLVPASQYTGKQLIIRKVDSTTNQVIIDPNGAETIDGVLSIYTQSKNNQFAIISTGSEWRISNGCNYSQVIIVGGNGLASTNTAIRRFTTVQTSLGSAITYSDSATLGMKLTINEPGTYTITYGDGHASGSAISMGLSLNSTQLTTNINTITSTDRIGHHVIFWCNALTTTVRCQAGDIIRAHGAPGYSLQTSAAYVWINCVKM